MNTRTEWVDYAKAIGIILVVYGHVARGVYNAGIEFNEQLYKLADSFVYSFHMPLFFFLSGLFFYQSFLKKGATGLTLNKIDTILYPYLIWSAVQGLIEVALSNYTNGNLTLTEVFSFWEPRAQFWFLYALFLIFSVCCFIYSLMSQKYVGILLLVSCVCYLNREVFPDIKSLSFLINNLVYFCLGIVFTKYNINRYLTSNAALFITTVTFLISQYLYHVYFGKLLNDKGIDSLLLAFASICFIVSLSIGISKGKSPTLKFLGASSMAIYLMHILAGSGVRVVLSKLFDIDELVLHLAIGTVVGILLPLIMVKVIDRFQIPYVFSAPVSKCLIGFYIYTIRQFRN